MSVPLLLVGASAGALLPRAGAWMVEVKAVFGVLLARRRALDGAAGAARAARARALGRCSRSAPRRCCVDARAQRRRRRRVAPATPPRLAWRQAVAALLGLVGVLQVVGAASGGDRSAAAARALLGAQRARRRRPACRASSRCSSVDELDAALKSAGRPVMLDFYADWCVSCKEMERFTFTDPAVQKKLAGALLLKADVTANNAAGPRAAEALQPVRPARNDLLRRRRRRDPRRAADRLPEQPPASSRPWARQGSEPAPRESARGKLRLPVARWSSLVARWAHNPKVAGSNPALATRFLQC